MENKVQLKTGDKIKIPTRKSLGDNLKLIQQVFRNKEYAYIGNKHSSVNAYYICKQPGKSGFGKFKLEDFDLYEEPTKFKEGDKVAIPTQKTFCNPYTLEQTLTYRAGKQMVADGFGLVDEVHISKSTGKKIINLNTKCNKFVGGFYEEDLVPYEEKAPEVTNERFFGLVTGTKEADETDKLYSQLQRKTIIWDSSAATKETEFKVGDLVEVPTTKSKGVISLTNLLKDSKGAVCGKITNIDAFTDYYYVELLNKDNKSLGGARFAKEDLVLKSSKSIIDALKPASDEFNNKSREIEVDYFKALADLQKAAKLALNYGAPISSLKQTIRTVKPDDVDLPGVGGTSFDIILDEYSKTDLFLASRGYGKSAAMWNAINDIHQQQENNKNALTILALRS